MNYQLSKIFWQCFAQGYESTNDYINYKFTEKGSTLFIWFQGSVELNDWFLNFSFWKKPYKDMKIPYYVHRGFLKAWKSVEDIVLDKIQEKIMTVNGDSVYERYKYTEIIVVGYSHGAAISGLCHEAVWFHRPDIRDNIFGYGFASPRFYHGVRVNHRLKERWANYTVVRVHTDIVTHVPPRLFGYTHVGNMLHIKPKDTSHIKFPKAFFSHHWDNVRAGLEEYENKLLDK